MSSEHQLWIFQVAGSGTFTLQIVGNPSLAHGGGMSATTLFLTDGQAALVEQAIQDMGFTVVRRLTAEQRTERLAILGSEDTVFPCSLCPQCYWFDPTVPGVCGRAAWPDSLIQASNDAHAYAREAELACPIQPWSH